MKIITEITPQVKNPKRCSIFLDGEFFCGMALETVMKNHGFKPYSAEWWHFSDTVSYPVDENFEPPVG